MRLLLIIAYFLLETFAFWGVSQLIGVGWALAALFITLVCGMGIALIEVKRLMSRQVISDNHGGLVIKQEGVGKLAGNVGLTLVGGLLLSAPGFVTSFIGLLMILPPTRALLRTFLSLRIVNGIEKAGVRFYEVANLGTPMSSYGTFTGGNSTNHPSEQEGEATVIDEDELRHWADSLDPDDFADGKGKSEGN